MVSTDRLPVLTNGNALIQCRNNDQRLNGQRLVAAALHQPGHGRRPLQRQQASGAKRLWVAPMAMQQQAGQFTEQRLVSYQQLDLGTVIELIDDPLWVGVRGQPVDRHQRAIKPRNLHHQLRGFLGTPIRADQHPLHTNAAQGLGTQTNFTNAALGQAPLRITGGMRLGLAMSQQPEFHNLGSSSRTGCGAGSIT